MDLDELENVAAHGDETEDLSALDRGTEFSGELPDDEEGAAALAREKADAEAKAKADEEAKAKADEEAKVKADEEAKAKADEEAKAKDGTPEPKDAEDEGRGHMIPKARFDEAQRRAREREAELAAELAAERAKTAVTATSEAVTRLQQEIDTLDVQYAAALKDGEADDAARLMKDIRTKERELAKAETGVESQHAAIAQAQAAEQEAFNVTLKGFEEQYPEMDPDAQNDAYDQTKVDAIVTLMNGYTAAGQPRTAALKQALALLGPTLKGRSAPVPEGKTDVQKKVEAERKAAATSKTAKALESQPASLKDAGLDSHKVGGGIDESQINNLTEEEFNALPASVLARMRGDSV